MLRQTSAELPDDTAPTEYEIEANAAFRNIVEHLKAGATNG
jgi:hypothetical protein